MSMTPSADLSSSNLFFTDDGYLFLFTQNGKYWQFSCFKWADAVGGHFFLTKVYSTSETGYGNHYQHGK